MAEATKLGRNDLCSCGSGKKFKKCCESKQSGSRMTTLMLVLIATLAVAGVLAAVSSFSTDLSHTGQATGVWSAEHGHYH